MNDSILKGLFKFQVDMPINARVKAVQSLEILHTFSLVGRQKNAHQLILPCNIIESRQTSLAHNSAFIGPNNFQFGTETCCMVL